MASEHDDERVPLLKNHSHKVVQKKQGWLSPYRRMLIVAFVLSFSFACTATPLIYAYRVFTCEEYYRTHPPYEGTGDRCAIHEIEKDTAQSLSLMVTLTTFSGVLNLLTTGWLMRKYGVRAALINQTAWPILRNICQITGIIKGGKLGIVIFQVTQLITIFGGGAGYLLAANSFVAAVVEPEDRTACFGQLQGVAMAGTALAFTVGGVLGDTFGQVTPFAFTLCLLIFSTLLSRFALPYLSPNQTESKDEDESKGIMGGAKSFFKPLKVFAPRKLESMKGQIYYGVTLLGVGNFMSVLATAYVPLMLQLISTNLYGFRSSENGYLMSTFSLFRAVFLTFFFPKIIKHGRAWYNKKHANDQDLDTDLKEEEVRLLSGDSDETETDNEETARSDENGGVNASSSSASATAASDEVDADDSIPANYDGGGSSRGSNHHSAFDLVFLRISILVDAILTSFIAYADKGWMMYVAAGILPLASGTAPASKGVVMEMVTAEQRPDALSAVSLIELTATVTTVSLFGAIFAYLSDIGKPNLVFILNGATALIAFTILLFVRLPPKAQAIIDDGI